MRLLALSDDGKDGASAGALAGVTGATAGIAAVFLLVVLAARGRLGLLRAHAAPLAIVGVSNSALPFTLLAYATLSVTAGSARKGIQLGRLGKPEEAAQAIFFLGTPLSSYTTGGHVDVSGGLARHI